MRVSRGAIKHAAGVAGGRSALGSIETILDAPETGVLPMRALGRTGRRVSWIGFGTAPLGSDATTPEEAERTLSYALDQGINFLDTAPVYGDPNSKYGNSENKLKGILQNHRKNVFLVTKVNAGRPDRDGVLQQLEESLQRMGVDDVDAVHIHNLGDFDMQQVIAPNGTLAGLREAREQGLLRYIGTSCHIRPARFALAIETGEIDVTMNVYNFADDHTYDFAGTVLPAARKYNTGIVAMKVLGGATEWKYDGAANATLAAYHEQAIRYTLGIPDVACAVIGFKNVEEVRQAVAVTRAYAPLTGEERETLLRTGKELAETRGLYYGPITES